jgi:LTXXQ motif family protein
MRSHLAYTVFAGLFAVAVSAAPTTVQAQQKPGAGPSAQALSAAYAELTDRRIEVVKAALELTAEQQKYWPAVEDAIRARAKGRQARLADVAARLERLEDRGPLNALRDMNPADFLNRRSSALSQRAAELKKLADAWQPLFQSLKTEQKQRLAFVVVYVLREIRDRAEDARMLQAEDESED